MSAGVLANTNGVRTSASAATARARLQVAVTMFVVCFILLVALSPASELEGEIASVSLSITTAVAHRRAPSGEENI